MNKKIKKMIAVGFVGLSLSGGISSLSNDIVFANQVNNSYMATNYDIGVGSLLSSYIKIEEKDGIKVFSLKVDDSLYEKLKMIDAKFTVDDLNNLVSRLNDVLVKENGKGPLTDVLKELEAYRLNIINSDTESSFRISPCSATFFGSGLLHSGIYTAAAYALGVTGIGSVLIPFLVSATYGAGGLLCP